MYVGPTQPKSMKVQIQTAQNVTLEYEPADIGHRVVAGIVDMLIRIAYVVGMSLLLIHVDVFGGDGMMAVFLLVLYAPILLYDLLFEVCMNGQSIGKKAANIRVVCLDGGQPSLGNYLLRWLIGLFEKNIFGGVIALIVILISGKGQRLGDMAAGTTVVRAAIQATMADTILVPTADDYAPTFSEVTRLSDKDIAVIKEVIDSPTHSTNASILHALVDRVQGVMGVMTELPPAVFLRIVVNDYSYITSRL